MDEHSGSEHRSVFDLRRRHTRAFGLALALGIITLLLYLPVLWHPFIAIDDHDYITQNPWVSGGLTWGGITWAFTHFHSSNWHPLTWFSHMADCQLFGLNAGGHHAANLLFHALNSVLLFAFLRRNTGSEWTSAIVAALFAWHPLHVESVAWVSERKDMLSCFFGILMLFAYRRYVETESKPRFTIVTVLFALGLMCKPMLVTFPFVLLLLDFWPFQRLTNTGGADSEPLNFRSSLRRLTPLLIEKVPLFLLSTTACVVTCLAQKGAMTTLDGLPLSSRVANAIVAYGKYLLKTIWPTNLAVVYPYDQHVNWLTVVAVLLMLLLLTVGCVFRMRKQPYLLVGWLWFLGTLVPTLGLVQVGSQSMADRYMYIPSIGLFVAIVWGAHDLLRGRLLAENTQARRVPVLACAAIIVLLLSFTSAQISYWGSDEALFRHAAQSTSQNYIALDAWGVACDELGRHQEALALCRQAAQLQPNYAEAHCDLGTFLLKDGQPEQAVEHLQKAIQLKPSLSTAHMSLGKALLETGKMPEAASHLEKAVQLSPYDPEARYNLGTLRLLQNQPDEAVLCFNEALRLKPAFLKARSNLAAALMRQGKLVEGAQQFLQVAEALPSDASAHRNLGLALLELGQPAKAEICFREAVRLAPGDIACGYDLALAIARQMRLQDAIRQAQQVFNDASAEGKKDLASQAEQLLKYCEAGGTGNLAL